MLEGEVVDELLDEHRLAHAGAAKQAGLAAADVGLEQVDRLDTRLKDLGLGGELVKGGRRMVDGIVVLHLGHLLAVDRLAEHVPDAPERTGAHGHGHGAARVGSGDAADETVGGAHRNGTHHAARQLALDLEDRRHMAHGRVRLDGERVVDRGDLPLELDVDNRADDTDDMPLARRMALDGVFDVVQIVALSHCYSSNALAPPTISLISVVMEAWRTRL